MRGNWQARSGICPNPQCRKKLFFPEHEASVECTGCRQRHTQSSLLERTGEEVTLRDLIEKLLRRDENATAKALKKESLKVHGLSNCLCTILSPLLTTYGMDKNTGKAKLLTEMGKTPVFDCAQLCDRAFFISPEHLDVPSYGRDRSGSSDYLRDTLDIIKQYNENEERLVPIHADGDGHCLVHAVSRALIGWELFWHPLRVNLKQHFADSLNKYKMLFQDFIDDREWQLIMDECDPDFVPTGVEPTGLRNIHIFGLANVLKRPIILLDCIEGIQSPGDYSGIFLPYFSPPSECMNKEGILNKPLCIAWSSFGRNHFIPLVGVKGKKCPVLSRHMIQRAWGVSDVEIDKYLAFDEHGMCQIGGEKILQQGYFQRLVTAMSEVFYQQHSVSPSLIADVYQYIFKANGFVCGMNLNLLLDKTKTSIAKKQLLICLNCQSLILALERPVDWCRPGGELYDLAVSCHKKLKDGQKYSFPLHDVEARYDASLDQLVIDNSKSIGGSCPFCSKTEYRLVRSDYSVMYKDGDRTFTKSSIRPDGFKRYFNGKEYDTIPKTITVLMKWGDKTVETKVLWFQGEEDPSLNSNVYEMAQFLVQKHFPGEFGSERLVQTVVDQILVQTKMPETAQEMPSLKASGPDDPVSSKNNDDPSVWSPHRASKAILTGLQRQSIHKEELNKSATERQVKQQIESKAPKQQRRLTEQTSLDRKVLASPTGQPDNRKTPERCLPSSPSSSSVKSSQPLGTSSASVSSQIPGSGDQSSMPAPVNKCIRLAISDGRNMTLDLPPECTYLELQSLISNASNIAPSHQRIRHGFPPKELKPPQSANEDYKVPIQRGDKVMLDIIQVKKEILHTERSPRPIDRTQIHGLPAHRDDSSWTAFAEGGMDEVSDRVLQGLMDPLLHNGGDTLDHGLSALALTAALENKSLWSYVQSRPHLFSVDGLFYKQVERDVGLENGKHAQLPLLPHKVFVYNAFDDRLELCLEPYGHFPIVPGVEKNVGSLIPSSKCVKKSSHTPFSGHGHSLRSSTSQEERMPTDVPMSPKRHEARRLNTLCDPAVHQESIEEEDEEGEEEMKDQEGGSRISSHRLNPADIIRNLPLLKGVSGAHTFLSAPDSKLVRKGPGYSELSPIPENSTNEKAEMLQQLVSRIERAVESMGQEAKAISEGRDIVPHQAREFSFTTESDSTSTTHSSSPAKRQTTGDASKQDIDHKQKDDSSMSSIVVGSSPSTTIPQPLVRSGGNLKTSLEQTPSSVLNQTSFEKTTSPLTSLIPNEAGQGEEPIEANSNMVAALAGEVALNIAAMDTDINPDIVVHSQHSPSEYYSTIQSDSDLPDAKKRLEEQEVMEAENESLRIERENLAKMERQSGRDGQTPMEEEVEEEAQETELDDLYIKEQSPKHTLESGNSGDELHASDSEKMESP